MISKLTSTLFPTKSVAVSFAEETDFHSLKSILSKLQAVSIDSNSISTGFEFSILIPLILSVILSNAILSVAVPLILSFPSFLLRI